MNQERVLNVLSLKGVGRAVINRQLPKLVLSVAALLGLALTACAPVPVGVRATVAPPQVEPVTPAIASDNEVAAESAFLAANPELMLARRHTAGPTAAFLASNPELMIARRYKVVVRADARADTLAPNPELASELRYVLSILYKTDNQAASASLLAANPELMAARRYLGSTVLGTDAAFLAANPELMAARRYAGSALSATDSAFLAENPELMAASRY